MEEKLNFDKVWAMFQETREQMKEAHEQMQKIREQDREQDREQMREIREQMKETDRKFQETSAQIKETGAQIKETDKQLRVEMKELSRHLGGIGNSNGAFAENYFYTSLNEKKMFGNEHFDRVDINVKPPLSADGRQDEYDIVLLNGKSVALIEVKYRAKKEHVAKTINKAITFRQFFPEYKDFTFYLGLAGCSFEEGVEEYALNAGLAVLKQMGDSVVIHDERIQKF